MYNYFQPTDSDSEEQDNMDNETPKRRKVNVMILMYSKYATFISSFDIVNNSVFSPKHV